VRIVVTGTDPYDLDIRLTWDDDEQRLASLTTYASPGDLTASPCAPPTSPGS
jgi:hypothetical protein